MATQMISRELSGVRKASILIMSLGASASSEVFKHLSDQEIETLTSEIMRTRGVDGRTRDAVIEEFERRCESRPKVGSALESVTED